MFKIIMSKAVIYPISLYVFAMLLLQGLDWDHQIASFWYQLEGNTWSLKQHWLTQAVLHKGGHDVAIALYIIIIVIYVTSFRNDKLKPYHQGLKYLVISLPIATLTISALKQLIAVDCPWGLVDFGGQRQYEPWFRTLFSTVQENVGHCFPSGHASSAYTYFALYFFCQYYFQRYAKSVLIAVIFIGIIFGFAQQLRGAHFLSHDLTSALICWLISWGIWMFIFRSTKVAVIQPHCRTLL